MMDGMGWDGRLRKRTNVDGDIIGDVIISHDGSSVL
jgi:hypothetical protein